MVYFLRKFGLPSYLAASAPLCVVYVWREMEREREGGRMVELRRPREYV